MPCGEYGCLAERHPGCFRPDTELRKFRITGDNSLISVLEISLESNTYIIARKNDSNLSIAINFTMILERLAPQSFSTTLLWLLGAILTRLLYNKYGHGLNNIPGPWLAGYTDLWRLFVVRGRRAQEIHIELHKKYGPAVRLGPRAVSIADTEALKIIYSPSAGWSKVTHDFGIRCWCTD